MTTYASYGPAAPGGAKVFAFDAAAWPSRGDALPAPGEPGVEALDPRLDLRCHSPSGFSWGYRGSGPAQLALAVLAHEYGARRALSDYQLFKERFVATVPQGEPFRATSEDIAGAIR